MNRRSPVSLLPLVPLIALAAISANSAALAAPPTSSTPVPAPSSGLAGRAVSGDAAGYHRVELPGGNGRPFPYSVEIPVDWQVREVKGYPGLWLGPVGAEPPNDPRLVYVRISPASIEDPAATVQAIRRSDEADASWSASLLEVKEVGGIKGVLVRMDSGEGDKARSTLTLKLPLAKTSVDFMASASRAQFETLRPSFERIFFSVQPAK